MAARVAVGALVAAFLAGCGGRSASWTQPNGSLSSTRAGSIGLAAAKSLRPVWRFAIPAVAGGSGAVTATPVVAGGTVYLQDMKSNVYALDLTDGKLRWMRRFEAGNPGPNGLAVDGGRVIGATDTTVFALSAKTGRELWTHRILSATDTFVDAAPLVAGGRIYIATTGYSFGTRGKLYALDEGDGSVDWSFDTIKGPWKHPQHAGGGGAWYAPSIEDGVVYWGTANPIPWGGTAQFPNGAAFPGPVLYTDSLVALDAKTGRLRWFDQVTPHDVRDYDFQLPPILAGKIVIGGGKGGVVVAWNPKTQRRLWSTPVGVHSNDRGPLPTTRVRVCPGILGGIETPMAEADGRVFAPVVDLCFHGSATSYESLAKVDPLSGRGELVALAATGGGRLWDHRFPSPDFGCATAGDGVVFTSTLDGHVYALDAETGRTVWTARTGAGINACPSIAGGTLLVPAGVPLPGRRQFELVAYR